MKALTDTQGRKLFSPEMVSTLMREVLEIAAENMETLIDPSNPQRQILATTLTAIARSLTTTTLAGRGSVADLFSKRQLVDLVRVAFHEVASHPEQLLHENMDQEHKTALAQIIGSVANALGDEPSRLVTGRGFIELVKIAIPVAVANAQQLLKLGSPSTRTIPTPRRWPISCWAP